MILHVFNHLWICTSFILWYLPHMEFFQVMVSQINISPSYNVRADLYYLTDLYFINHAKRWESSRWKILCRTSRLVYPKGWLLPKQFKTHELKVKKRVIFRYLFLKFSKCKNSPFFHLTLYEGKQKHDRFLT